MIGYRSSVFHMTYCTRYCLKSPLEHLTITFSFLTGLYFFQHWFFFAFLFISSSWRKRTHCVKADRTRIRPTVCAGCIQGLQALPFSSPISQRQLCSILWSRQDMELCKTSTLWSTGRPRFLHTSAQSLSLSVRKIGAGMVRMESFIFPAFEVVFLPWE